MFSNYFDIASTPRINCKFFIFYYEMTKHKKYVREHNILRFGNDDEDEEIEVHDISEAKIHKTNEVNNIPWEQAINISLANPSIRHCQTLYQIMFTNKSLRQRWLDECFVILIENTLELVAKGFLLIEHSEKWLIPNNRYGTYRLFPHDIYSYDYNLHNVGGEKENPLRIYMEFNESYEFRSERGIPERTVSHVSVVSRSAPGFIALLWYAITGPYKWNFENCDRNDADDCMQKLDAFKFDNKRTFTKPVIGKLKNMCILKRPFGLQRCNPGGFTMLYAAFRLRQLLQLPPSILEMTEHIMNKRVIQKKFATTLLFHWHGKEHDNAEDLRRTLFLMKRLPEICTKYTKHSWGPLLRDMRVEFAKNKDYKNMSNFKFSSHMYH